MGNNPKPTGKYAVGTTTFTAKEERDEVLKPVTKRRISARVYYPVMKEALDGFEKVQYMSRDMFKELKDAFKLPLDFDKETAAGHNISECYKDATRITGEKFPLIIFNHGCLPYSFLSALSRSLKSGNANQSSNKSSPKILGLNIMQMIDTQRGILREKSKD